MNFEDFIYISNVKCPHCGQLEKVAMPRYASKYHYQCQTCKKVFETKYHECCIFCSYGDVPCPAEQQKRYNDQINLLRNKPE